MSTERWSEATGTERRSEAASADERAVLFHCPFCGEEDLRPSEAAPRAWECRCCTRVFAVVLFGLMAREVSR